MQHTDLQKGSWHNLTAEEQMANIGSEIYRAIKWKDKKIEYANLANVRALELFDLSLSDPKHKSALKEFSRARELWLDFFIGGNKYHQTSDHWIKYFYYITIAARNKWPH